VVVARGSFVVDVPHALLLHMIVIPLAASRVDPLFELNFKKPVLDNEQPFTFVELDMVSDSVSLAPTAAAAALHSDADVMEQYSLVSSHCPTTSKLKSQ